jgi:hypothetical protein
MTLLPMVQTLSAGSLRPATRTHRAGTADRVRLGGMKGGRGEVEG